MCAFPFRFIVLYTYRSSSNAPRKPSKRRVPSYAHATPNSRRTTRNCAPNSPISSRIRAPSATRTRGCAPPSTHRPKPKRYSTAPRAAQSPARSGTMVPKQQRLRRRRQRRGRPLPGSRRGRRVCTVATAPRRRDDTKSSNTNRHRPFGRCSCRQRPLRWVCSRRPWLDDHSWEEGALRFNQYQTAAVCMCGFVGHGFGTFAENVRRHRQRPEAAASID